MNTLLPLLLFIACYVLFVLFPKKRALVACGGALLLVLSPVLSWREVFTEVVQWNVVFLFFGTLILAELFMQSRMPAVLAERLVAQTRTVRGAMMVLCVLASGLSAFVENVAVVLLVAPVAFSLAKRLNVPPKALLIALAICSNLQGTATLIGDPPSMILAGYMKMNFNDFFFYHGKPGIFFAVQVGAIASLIVLRLLFREHRAVVSPLSVESPLSLVPSFFLAVLLLGLALASSVDPDFRWFAGTFTCGLAIFALVWYRLKAHWTPVRKLVGALDWDTTFFLFGVFVLVGGLARCGILESVAQWLGRVAGNSAAGAFVLIVGLSVVVSAFVDNVPYLIATIPVAQYLADRVLAVPGPLLIFALLIGACLGGNITPIGASANIVSIGMLRREGYVVSFREFLAIGLPFTLAAVFASSLFVWYIWAY